MTVQTTVMTKARTAFNQVLEGILADVETSFLVESIDGINTYVVYEELGKLPDHSIVSITTCAADIQYSFANPDDFDATLFPEIVHKHGAHLLDKGMTWHPCPAASSKEVVTLSLGQEKAWSGDQEGP